MTSCTKRTFPVAAIALLCVPAVSAGQWVGGNVGLLSNTKVQAELKLDEAQLAKVQSLIEDFRGRLKVVLKEVQELKLSREERCVELFERAQSTNRDVKKQLAMIIGSEQFKRYDEIELQRNELGAVLDPAIQKKLKLTDAQQRKIKSGVEDLLRAQAVLAKEYEGKPRTSQERMTRFQAMKAETTEKVTGLFSDDQMKTWIEMQGATLPER
jgi:hypothetical protein